MTMVQVAETVSGKGKRRSVTIRDVWAKESEDLTVPVRDVSDPLEGITLGFRQEMLSVLDANGNGGRISTATGLGGEAINLEWKDGDKECQAVVRGSELLAAWVATFDADAAAGIRKAAGIPAGG